MCERSRVGTCVCVCERSCVCVLLMVVCWLCVSCVRVCMCEHSRVFIAYGVVICCVVHVCTCGRVHGWACAHVDIWTCEEGWDGMWMSVHVRMCGRVSMFKSRGH